MALDIDSVEANIENLDDAEDDFAVVVLLLDIDTVANNEFDSGNDSDSVEMDHNTHLADADSRNGAGIDNRFDNGQTIWTLWPMEAHLHLISPYPLCWEILNLCLRYFPENLNEQISG
jgi:hypothetical protein